MKIIITGAAGFIGSNLVAKLLNEGHEVIGIDNFSYGLQRNITSLIQHKNFTFIEGDVLNPFNLKEVKGDVLLHLASQKIPRYSSAYRTLEENNLMLKIVIEKCLRDKIKFVFASTSDVYGKNTKLPFREDSDLVLGNTKVKRWAYALSKIYGEQYVIANHEEFNLNYSIVRFFGSYGPNHNLTWWGGPQSGFITKALNNEEIELHGDGLQTRTFTFIQDTIEALSHVVLNEKANGEIFNIASDPSEEITIKGLAELIWELVHGKDAKAKLKYIPYSTFGNYEDVMRRVPDITKIQALFNYQPKHTLRDGLQKTLEWQKQILKNSK
jgi:UDP-glucose 4-epimerase